MNAALPLPDMLAALLLTAALLAWLRILHYGSERLRNWIESRAALHDEEPAIAGAARFGRPNPLAGRRVQRSLLGPLRLLRRSLAVAALAAWAYALFWLFPAAHPWGLTLRETMLLPANDLLAALLAYLPKLGFIVLVTMAAFLLIRLLRFAFAELGKGVLELPGFPAEWAEPTYRIARFVVLAFAAVMIYPYLPGAETRAFEGVSLLFGAMLTLGSSAAVANVIAGIVLTYTHAFRIGDRVRIADTEGDVIGRALLATRIRTNKNVDITVPNAKVLADHIINYSAAAAEHGLIVHDEVTIGYDVSWRQVHELLIAAARQTDLLLADPPPFVLQTGLDDFYARYTINAYTREPNRLAAIYSELRQHIQDVFHQAGIEIASAHYLALRDGSRAAMPAEFAAAAQPLRVVLGEDADPTPTTKTNQRD